MSLSYLKWRNRISFCALEIWDRALNKLFLLNLVYAGGGGKALLDVNGLEREPNPSA